VHVVDGQRAGIDQDQCAPRPIGRGRGPRQIRGSVLTSSVAVTLTNLWDLIDRARAEAGDDAEDVAAKATELLGRRSAEEIIEVERERRTAMAESYRADLWGAAYLINGGCSDDGFEYFRGWLIMQGRRAYEQAVADPDSLADLPAIRQAANDEVDVECEDGMALGWNAYRSATGTDLPQDAVSVRYPAISFDWDFEDTDEAGRRLPRLTALYGADD
jgi:Protein of unknown function (DUF4240)